MKKPECSTSGLSEKIPYKVFLYYKLSTFIPAFTGCYAIYLYSGSISWLIGYFALFLLHVTLVYKLKCTHCSYYKAPGKSIQCMWLWGVPKVFDTRSGPESNLSRIYVPFGMAIVAFYPVYWLLNNWPLLIIYFTSIAAMVLSLFLFTCSKCTYFECAHNQVPEDEKNHYLSLH